MKKKLFQSGVLAILTCVVLIAGCGYRHTRQVDYDPYRSQAYYEAYGSRLNSYPYTERSAPPYTRAVDSPTLQLAEFGTDPAPERSDENEKVRSISLHPPGDASTSLIRIERIAPAQVTLNQAFDCVINVTNISKTALTAVTVSEPYSKSFKYESATPAPRLHKDGTLVWDLGNLASLARRTITLRGHATSGTRLSDCVTVTCTYAPRACIDIKVVDPKLELVQTGPKTVLQCDPIPITLTAKNNGTGVARNVVIKEALPNGLLTFDGKSRIFAQVGDLGAGESKTIKMNLKAAKAGKYDTEAEATGQGSLKSTAAYSLMVVNPSLVLTKSGPDKRFVGRPASYDITVANKGDGVAKDVVVTDVIPSAAVFVSASSGGQFSEGKVIWNLASLAPGASKKLSVKMKLDKIGTVVNKAMAEAHCASASAEARTKVFGIAAILLEVIDLEDPIEVGSNETYVISVTNQGTAVGTNVRVVATLPAEMGYISSSGPTVAAVNGKTVTFAPLARLAPKATVKYKVIVKGITAGDLRFGVKLKSDQMTSPVMETESTHAY